MKCIHVVGVKNTHMGGFNACEPVRRESEVATLTATDLKTDLQVLGISICLASTGRANGTFAPITLTNM